MCRREFPDLAASGRELADDLVVVTLTTSASDTQERINDAMKEAREAFVVGRADSETQTRLRGLEGGGSGNPYTVFIDKEGKVRSVRAGGATQEYFTGTAKKMLE